MLNNSDYTKRININDLIPAVNKTSPVLETIIENTLNRYLSKSDFKHVEGFIGKPNNDDSIPNITEIDEFSQKYQLQPVVYNKFATVDKFLSFNDFLNKLKLLGVNTDKFDEWGKFLQFNWVPPIDIDKISNFSDYFWNSISIDDQPQYVTIKNRCNFLNSKFNQYKKSFSENLIKFPVIINTNSVISIDGNKVNQFTVGENIIYSDNLNNYQLVTITNIVFNNSSLRTDITIDQDLTNITVLSIVKTKLIIIGFNSLDNTLKVAGDLTRIFSNGFIFSTINSPSDVTLYWEVESSTFNPDIKQTTIKVKNNITLDFDWMQISVLPILSLVKSELLCNCSDNVIDFITDFDDSEIGNLIFGRFYTVIDKKNTGSTLFSTNSLNDNSINFISMGVKPTDILEITYDSGQIIKYPIFSVVQNSVIVDSKVKFFARTSLKYRIFRNIQFNSLITEMMPSNPVIGQYWINSIDDTLNQWDGNEFVKLQKRISILYNIINNRNLDTFGVDNEWAIQNKWIHVNDIKSFDGLVRATMPIIEFNSHLELSNTSISTKKWKYRSDSNIEYVPTNKSPLLFELFNITLGTVLDPEFAFQTDKIIILNEKYGNLTKELINGYTIILENFQDNNGIYEIDFSEYVQINPSDRFVTKLYLKTALKSTIDLPQNARIKPEFTSMGDVFGNFDTAHWFFDGIENILPSSINPIKNPMLDIAVSSGLAVATPWIPNTVYDLETLVTNDNGKIYKCILSGTSGIAGGPTGITLGIPDNNVLWDFVSYNFNYILGTVWEEISFVANNIKSPLIKLHESLHDLCLYEDYQEGDLRIYLDGVRQYGNFTEFRSNINSDYVGFIQLNNITINSNNVIRIELGEYALDDIGKRAVKVFSSSGLELYNLVDIKKIEQEKTEKYQYPFFRLYDINKIPLDFSSNIFSFQEDNSSIININTLRRLKYDQSTKDFFFNNELVGPNKELYLYKDRLEINNQFQSIWKRGINNEQYIPKKLNSGQWELPNPWQFNTVHENKASISSNQLFKHFSTIISQQKIPGVISSTGQSLYFVNDNVNYGLGGTIKEHNNGIDLLISTLLVDDINIIDVIQFGHDQYINQLNFIQNELQDNFANYLLNDSTDINTLIVDISEIIKDTFETNSNLGKIFGDSTTYNELQDLGVKNFVATLPYFNLVPKSTPYLVIDSILNIIELNHHDGHRSNPSFNIAVKESILKTIQKLSITGIQNITNDLEDFPSLINDVPVTVGSLIIRINTQNKSKKIFRLNGFGNWDELNLDLILANVLLNFEKSLFNNLPNSNSLGNFTPQYSLIKNTTNDDYPDLASQQFNKFVKKFNISTPFSSADIFKSNNPFTWNYAFSPIPINPKTGAIDNDVSAVYQSLYKKVYGTAYPHREPWILQGYLEKPQWWDDTYKDTTNTRIWKNSMWLNISTGIIPVGKITPNGLVGSGSAGQIEDLFQFFSVNIDNFPTLDGIPPDGLLPPFWDTKNTNNLKVRSLYDPSLNQFIITPQSDYLFGQEGPVEWDWKISAQRAYDDLIISFKLDPIKFTYFTFGNNYININCLQVDNRIKKVFSHKDTIFHGDFLNDNEIYLTSGINQWYVNYIRYNEIDDINSGFKSNWLNWIQKLSYIFDSFIDVSNFNIISDIFDITNKDYELLIKKTTAVDVKTFDSISATVLNVPSQFIKNRDNSSAWVVQFTNNSQDRITNYYSPENYDFRYILDNTFRIYSYDILDISIENMFGFQIINYNQNIIGSLPTNLSLISAYWFTITIDNGQPQQFNISGQNAQTFDDLIHSINLLLGNSAISYIENGNIIVRSNSTGPQSTISIVDNGLFTSATPETDVNNLPLPIFNNISVPLQSPINFLNKFNIRGNKLNVFSDKLIVKNSTNYNGIYDINKLEYDIVNDTTIITVNDDIVINNLIKDGIIEPLNAKTLPETWDTGTEVVLSTSGALPSGLDAENNYYLIKLNSREFKLADSVELAKFFKPVIINSSGNGEFFIGRLQSTFSILDGSSTSIKWRRHFSDKRYVEQLNTPITISGIQKMIDFIKGNEDFITDSGILAKSVSGENIDPQTGRINNWLLETEKFINNLYIMKSAKNTDAESYDILPNYISNNFSFKNNFNVNFRLGTQIILSSDQDLPTEFNNPILKHIPYYIVPTTDKNKFQLALSLLDARNGKAIRFTDNGSGNIKIQIFTNTKFIKLELNPYKEYFYIKNDKGILSNLFNPLNNNLLNEQEIYDNNGNQLSVNDLIILRQDKESRISLTLGLQELNDVSPFKRYIRGAKLYFDGFQHILTLNHYASDNSLIYDPFLGLNTPRLFIIFDKQKQITLRPNVGGYVLSNNSLVKNFEASTDMLRNLYNHNDINKDSINFELLTKSLGYDGPKEYMTNLKINNRTQFNFWRGMIQNKGTMLSANAFINQKVFSNLMVDEFWAYKLFEFGDVKEKNTLDLKLLKNDVSNKELRLEFVVPDSNALNTTFKSIRLTDNDRWFDEPDQLAKLDPIKTFYFNFSVLNTLENAENLINIVNGKFILELGGVSDGILISHFNNTTYKRILLEENIDYVYLNNTSIIFIVNPFNLTKIRVSRLSYNYNSQNPAKIIDRKAGNVVSDIPIFNPILGQYYNIPNSVVDFRNIVDQAKYNNKIDNSIDTDFWNHTEVGKVWFDNSIEYYLPYYDQQIFPDINDRLANHGKLAEFGDIKLYEWVESDVPPDQWNLQVSLDFSNTNIVQADKKSGVVYTKLYKNIGSSLSPIWIEEIDQHYETTADLVSLHPINILFGTTNIVKIYKNGKFLQNLDLGNSVSASNNLINFINLQEDNSYIHVILPAHIPSQTELDNLQYKLFTPYSVVSKINKDTTESINLYYFWVNKKITKSLNKLLSINEAEKLFKNMSAPYMIITGFRNNAFGYGLVYGNVFDEQFFQVPFRYSQCIVRGLGGLVGDNDRYSLRFNRDFTLRDKALPNLNNKHTEWKLFREKQIIKIDEYLWIKLVEALIGNLIENRQITQNIVPSLDRILFDDLYGADTQYGLGKDQIFTKSDISLKTINGILQDPNVDFKNIDIEDFLSNNKFITKIDILTSMFKIYDTFPTNVINYIYFQTLRDAFSVKKKYKEIFKTSWVAIQVVQNVVLETEASVDDVQILDINGECFDGLSSNNSNNIITTTEFSIYISKDGFINYISFNGITQNTIKTQLLNRISGAGDISGIWTDNTYLYVLSLNGGLDVFFYNGNNFLYIDSVNTEGTGRNIIGFNPILTVSEFGAGLSIYDFDGVELSLVAKTIDFGVSNVRDVTLHNDYIITCGEGRLDAWQYINGQLVYIATLGSLNGGTDIIRIVSDGNFLYTGSNNNVKIQIFTFDGIGFNQIYTDDILTSGKYITVGDGYLFSTGSDLNAYEFDGTDLTLVDAAEVGLINSDIKYSADTKRLYVNELGIFNFSNNKFEILSKNKILENEVASFVLGNSQFIFPAPSATPTMTPTPTPTRTITPSVTPIASVTPTLSNTPTITPTISVSPSPSMFFDDMGNLVDIYYIG